MVVSDGGLPSLGMYREIDVTAKQRQEGALRVWILRSDGLGGTGAEKRSLERL